MRRTITCIAIVSIDGRGYVVETKGKKRLVECRKQMILTGKYTYTCPDGHVRHHPWGKWTLMPFREFIPGI